MAGGAGRSALVAPSGRRRERAPLSAVLAGCTLVLAAVMVLGIAIGSVRLSPSQVWQVIADHISGHPKSVGGG